MSRQQQSNVGGTEELIPTKQALKSLKSDVTHVTAIEELVSNAIDNALRENSLAEGLNIDISAERHDDEDRTELVVRDNAGGVRRKNANIVFTLGDSAESTDEPLIGAYGLGAKKALMNLGIPFTIASRHNDAEVGWSYTIDEEWVSNDTDWAVEVTPERDLDAGVTEIRVHDLDYDWFGDEDEDEEATYTPERLREEFGRTYNLFLGDFGGNDYDVNIEVQGEAVEPLGAPDYSFTPVDDMYPRRFENITIDLDGYATTEVAITVGLLRESDGDAAGVDVYMQGQQILYAARDERVGFGSGLDRFDPQHDGRLKIVVEMETTGDGRDLPWDTQKNDIDQYNPIMEKVTNWVGRTAADYHFLDDVRVEAGFVSPYSPSIPEAANGGNVAAHDFTNQARVTSPYRPGTDQDEVEEINWLVHAHAEMHFRCERAIHHDDLLPAYRQRLDDVFGAGIAYTDLHQLDVDPVEFNEDEAADIATKIEALVSRHLDESVELTEDLHIWQVPKYEAALREELTQREISREDLTEPEEPPEDLPTTIDDLGGEEGPGGADPTPGNSPLPDEAEREDEAEDDDGDEFVEVALRLVSDDAGKEAILSEGTRSEMVAALDLDDEPTDDEIAAELGRRLEVALEF
jgi:hypothetical protein